MTDGHHGHELQDDSSGGLQQKRRHFDLNSPQKNTVEVEEVELHRYNFFYRLTASTSTWI